MKFQVGDRVRFVKNILDEEETIIDLNALGTVIGVGDKFLSVKIDGIEGDWYYFTPMS